MTLQCVSVELRTGAILAELPDLLIDWPLRHTIGAADTMQAHLPLASAPENWLTATTPGEAALVVLDVDEDDPAADPRGVPVGGGYITYRERGSAAVADLSFTTIEGYLGRRYVGTVTYAATPQNSIAADLIARYVVDGAGGRPGLPIRTVILPTPPPGTAGNTVRDRAYRDTDDAKVLLRLQQLAGITSGLEFVAEWEWRDDFNPPRLCPVLFIGDRIGAQASGGQAAAVFDMPGSVTEFHVTEDYSDGKGANDILAWSSGQGDSRPQSSRQVAADFHGRPTFEHRWSPSSSISDVNTLNAYALRALQIVNDGSTALSMVASARKAPRLGADWRLGDDIGYQLGGPDEDGIETAPGFPGGLRGVNRCIATERTLTTVTPILAVAEIPTEDS